MGIAQATDPHQRRPTTTPGVTTVVPLVDIPGVMPRAAKIAAGYMERTSKNGKVITYPVGSRTLVFRCNNPELLNAAQKIVGGTVSKSPNPRAEGVWRLVSAASEIDAVLATDSARYETWAGDRKVCDCDGDRCRFRIDSETGHYEENVPCWCAAQGLHPSDPRTCRLTTRVSLLIPAFADIPGIGVWQLESRGKTTFQNIKGLHEMLRGMRLPSAAGASVTLKIEIARGHTPGTGKPSQFPVFRIDSKLSINQTVERARAFAARTDLRRLPPPDDSTPPLGASLTAEEEALSSAAPIRDVRKDAEKRGNGLDDAIAAAEELAASLDGTTAGIQSSSDTDGTAAAPRGAKATPSASAVAGGRSSDETNESAKIVNSTSAIPAAPSGGTAPSDGPTTAGGTLVTAPDALAASSPKPLTADERRDFKRLIAEAARAEGLSGATPGQDWLARHFGARSLDTVVGRLDELIERANAAIAKAPVAAGKDDGNPAPASEPTGTVDAAKPPTRTSVRMPAGELRALIHKAAVIQHVKGKTPGKSWLVEHYGVASPDALTESQYEDVVRKARALLEDAVPGEGSGSRPQMVTAESIAALDRAFTRLQFTNEMRVRFIRKATDERAERTEDMTEVEIRALTDELSAGEDKPATGPTEPAPPAA